MILHRYFARRFLTTFLGILTVFFLLLALIDLVEQLRRFALDGIGFGRIAQLTLLNMPRAISDILPLVMILSTIALFLGLARSSELVVTRASGRSGLRALHGSPSAPRSRPDEATAPRARSTARR